MKRKFLSVVLSLCMIFSIFVGCKKEKTADTVEEPVSIPETQYLATPEEAAALKEEFFAYAGSSAVVQNSDIWNLVDGTAITFHVEELTEVPDGLHIYYDEDDKYGTRRPEEYKHTYKVWASVVEAGYENVTESDQDPVEGESLVEEETAIGEETVTDEEIVTDEGANPEVSEIIRENIPYEFVLNPHMLPADEETGVLYGYNVAWEEGSTDDGKIGIFDMFPFYIFTDSDNFYIEFYETISENPTGVLVQIFSPNAQADIETENVAEDAAAEEERDSD